MLLQLENVHTHYGNIEALKGVSVDVEQGQIVTIIGSNGAGKSTLLMTICGSPKASKGRVVYDGRDITRLATYDIVNLGISQAPEGRRIFSADERVREPADGGRPQPGPLVRRRTWRRSSPCSRG